MSAPIQRPVLDRLRRVFGSYDFRCFEIRQRSRDLQDAVIGSRRHPQAVERLLEEARDRGRGPAMTPNLRGAHLRVRVHARVSEKRTRCRSRAAKTRSRTRALVSPPGSPVSSWNATGGTVT